MRKHSMLFVFVIVIFFANCGGQSKVDFEKKDAVKNEKKPGTTQPSSTQPGNTQGQDKTQESTVTQANQADNAAKNTQVSVASGTSTSEIVQESDATPTPSIASNDNSAVSATKDNAASAHSEGKVEGTGYNARWYMPPRSEASAEPTQVDSGTATIKIRLQRRTGIWAYDDLMPITGSNFRLAPPDNLNDKDSQGNPKYNAFFIDISEHNPRTLEFNVEDRSTSEYKYSLAFTFLIHFTKEGSPDKFTVVRKDTLRSTASTKTPYYKSSQVEKYFNLDPLNTDAVPNSECNAYPERCATQLTFESDFSDIFSNWVKDEYKIDITYANYFISTPSQ